MNKQPAKQIILGIDPGTSVLGYGIICCTPKDIEFVAMGALTLNKIKDHYKRLNTIYEQVVQLISCYKVEIVAIEAPFYGKNVQSMLKLGRAQGIAIAAAMQQDLAVFEYAPRKVKQSITGNGNASKEQVASVLSHIVRYGNESSLDATDALAVAVCHTFNRGVLTEGTLTAKTKKPKGNWADFIAANPDKIA